MVFSGFSESTVQFWSDLATHNDKAWFDANRALYDREVLDRSRAFVSAMGTALERIAPDVHADPRVNQSLFRINRDVRFSKDKSPYKTHMGIWMWEGGGKRMECSGFYFHLDGAELMVAVGLYQLPKPLLEAYRESCVDPKHGDALAAAVAKVREAGAPYEVGISHYKRVPRGYDKDHPNAELLKHSGLIATYKAAIPPAFHGPELIDWCFERYEVMLPVHRWCREMIQRADG